jgi:hypothetical protein
MISERRKLNWIERLTEISNISKDNDDSQELKDIANSRSSIHPWEFVSIGADEEENVTHKGWNLEATKKKRSFSAHP